MGIQLIHLGIIMLLVGQLATQAGNAGRIPHADQQGRIQQLYRKIPRVELAFSDVTNPSTEKVVTIPQEILEQGGTIRTAELPSNLKLKGLE